jgi:hypothetical protein
MHYSLLLPCHGRGRGFESRRPRQFFQALARRLAACLRLTLKRLIDLLGVESHNHRTINDNHRSGHISKFLEIGQGAGILSYVSLLKGHAFLRKILFRFVAERSPMLRINHDVLRHFPRPAGVRNARERSGRRGGKIGRQYRLPDHENPYIWALDLSQQLSRCRGPLQANGSSG